MKEISILLDKEVYLMVEGFHKLSKNSYDIKIYKDIFEYQSVAIHYKDAQKRIRDYLA